MDPKHETLFANTLLQSIHDHTHFIALNLKYNEALQRLKTPSSGDRIVRRGTPHCRALDELLWFLAQTLDGKNPKFKTSIIEDLNAFLNKEQKQWLKEAQAEVALDVSDKADVQILVWMVLVVKLARAWGYDYVDMRHLHADYEDTVKSVEILDQAFGVVAYDLAVTEVNTTPTKSKA